MDNFSVEPTRTKNLVVLSPFCYAPILSVQFDKHLLNVFIWMPRPPLISCHSEITSEMNHRQFSRL
jgi:hypothetical protein